MPLRTLRFLVPVLLLWSTLVLNAQEKNDEEDVPKILKAAQLIYQANWLANLNNLPAAISYARNAGLLFDEVGWPNGVVTTTNFMAKCFYLQQQIDSMGVYARAGHALISRDGVTNLSRAGALFHMGAYHLSYSRLDSAIFYLEQAPPLLEEDPEIPNMDSLTADVGESDLRWLKNWVQAQNISLGAHIVRGHAHNQLGLAYLLGMEVERARSLFRLALDSYEKSGLAPLQAAALINWSQTYMGGDLKDSLRVLRGDTLLQKAQNLLSGDDGEQRVIRSLILRLRAQAARLTGRKEAADLFRESVRTAEEAPDSYLVQLLGVNAEQYRLFSRLQERVLFQAPADTATNTTEWLAEMQSMEEAFLALRQKDVFLDRDLSAHIWFSIGKGYAQLMDWEKAQQAFRRAMREIYPDLDLDADYRSDLEHLLPVSRNLGMHVLLEIAETYEAQYRKSGNALYNLRAHEYFEAAAVVLEKRRYRYAGHSGMSLLSESVLMNADYFARRIYSGAIRTLHAMEGSSDLLDQRLYIYFEKAKAYVLRHALPKAMPDNLLPAAMMEREKTLKDSLAILESRLIQHRKKGETGENPAALEKAWLEKSMALEAFIEDLERRFPQYYRLRYQLEPVPLAQVRSSLLTDSSAVRNYLFGSDHNLFVLTVTAKDLEVEEISLPEAFSDWLQYCRRYFRRPPDPNDRRLFLDYLRGAQGLYRTLLPPAADGGNSIRHWIIVPDQDLHFLSWDYLVQDTADMAGMLAEYSSLAAFDYRNTPFALYDHSFQMAQSLDALYHQSRMIYPAGAEAPSNFLDYGGFEPVYENGLLNFSEAGEMAALFAGKSKVWSQMLSWPIEFPRVLEDNVFNIFHFSGHGALGDRYVSGAALLFPGDEQNTAPFELMDLYRTRLRANLGIISACDSGASERAAGGEGLMSMGRGFFYAGCPSLLLGMWPLENRSTRGLLRHTLQYLKKGYTVAGALRQAKLDHLARKDIPSIAKSPYYWAGLSLWGDNRRLVF